MEDHTLERKQVNEARYTDTSGESVEVIASNDEGVHASKEVETPPRRRTMLQEAWDWTKAIVIALFLAYLIRTFVFAPTIVDGESMLDTLHNHERLIVNKMIYYFTTPKHGDIIVFHATENKDFIKRVIAVGGDHVEMKNDTLYINGEVVPEPYLDSMKKQFEQELALAHSAPLPFTEDFTIDAVPPGTVFVLGDNRRNSTDSRMLGPIPLDRVVGRAEVTFWPLDRMRMLHP
ncbi:MAG: Signal peptidase I [Candidatus Carbobacillus altaicus]|uniref:Signal peptidase I n=1 Tax=Candidatus Carbonibacillus altaicus TaxID=2163959 RepID=A0A2R6Y4Y7_9BACL|nr:MAG: Signal peptidase I [Candidatus Carbobacillus altaicus]